MKRIALAAAVLVFAACAPKDGAATADSATAAATAQAPEAAPTTTDSVKPDSAAAPHDSTKHQDQ